jgi:hypothetical protein
LFPPLPAPSDLGFTFPQKKSTVEFFSSQEMLFGAILMIPVLPIDNHAVPRRSGYCCCGSYGTIERYIGYNSGIAGPGQRVVFCSIADINP